ncbi:ABC transporter substrate-binding protein [Vibrio sp. S234-5]|uniref:substrate-binding periplasmic protein n=1 Tax=Vibrio sp. S234-5 TaxID=1616781 RepID=UPI0005EFDB68|nr:ABC transporter substrate-binding protein [Vibrio sp. S234-5]KJR21348.1 ABC transporter substrate-binding protein [Vibrio sp. S234-5]
MRKSNKIGWQLLIGLSILATTSHARSTQVIIYSDDAYPPYSYQIQGKATGIYPDILRQVFEKMPEFTVIIKPVPFKRGLRLLETGKGFALFPPYKYPNHRPYVNPYSVPILQEEVVVYCHNDVSLPNGPRLTRWPEDFYGKTIGINAAFSIGGEAFWNAARDGQLRVEEAKDNQENILKMRAKRIDCYINDKLSIAWEIKRLKLSGRIDKSEFFQLAALVSTEYGYLGYTAYGEDFPYKEKFVAQFDRILLDLQQAGVVEQVIRTYTD